AVVACRMVIFLQRSGGFVILRAAPTAHSPHAVTDLTHHPAGATELPIFHALITSCSRTRRIRAFITSNGWPSVESGKPEHEARPGPILLQAREGFSGTMARPDTRTPERPETEERSSRPWAQPARLAGATGRVRPGSYRSAILTA